jgi:3'(2'), 5'-bisphosphate nucleotidase
VSRVGLETLRESAAEAACLVREIYEQDFTVEFKGPGDPVTAADRRSNALLVERLQKAFPGVPVVSEEGDPSSFGDFRRAERVLFVDPLDGTREFVDRNGEFVVMIGLVVGRGAAAGVIHAPVSGVAWIGGPGLGAWRVEPLGPWVPIHVSATGELAQARVVASRSHRSVRLERSLAALGARELRPMGSAGLKGAEVAQGGADAYVDTSRGLQRWDVCAVDALVTAAGGRVSDVAGAPIDYRGESLVCERGLVASNGLTHEAILARLARTGRRTYGSFRRDGEAVGRSGGPGGATSGGPDDTTGT